MKSKLTTAALLAFCAVNSDAREPAMDEMQKSAVQTAIALLSEKQQISAAEIEVKSTEAVDWPSSALGCPKKGMMYLDVITPGYRVVLSDGQKTYTVHTGDNRALLCDRRIPPIPSKPDPQ